MDFGGPLHVLQSAGYQMASWLRIKNNWLPKVHDDGAVPRFKPVELSTKKGLRGRQTSDDKKGAGKQTSMSEIGVPCVFHCIPLGVGFCLAPIFFGKPRVSYNHKKQGKLLKKMPNKQLSNQATSPTFPDENSCLIFSTV